LSRQTTERRTTVRRIINREFSSVDEFIKEYVNNISRSGAFIRSDDPLPVGTKVQLRFSVILDELETVEGIGEVVRVVAPGGAKPPGMGVVFTELNTFSRQLLERLMVRR
jgi:uncharacterized protein (TIGR02266 family)